MSQPSNSHILVVDDEPFSCEFISSTLQEEGYEVTTASSGEAAMRLLRETEFPVIVSDMRLGAADGLELLRFINTLEHPSAVIIVTGHGSLDTAVKAIHDGAFDYISKPLDLFTIKDEIKNKVDRAIQHLRSLRGCSQKEDSAYSTASVKLIGQSAKMVDTYKMIAKASMAKSTVLIYGESGTGKELVARAIHENSPRKAHKLVTVNCCALTETLLESELFGHTKGSFTGATGNKVGLFEEADGGTIFLDEIGDVSPALQVKLLRVLQEGEIKPVGANYNKRVDVRVIAATNKDLESQVKEGKFREDLYYRLKVLFIALPPLRERRDDIPRLVNHFLHLNARNSQKSVGAVSDEAMEKLCAYGWPGNIRELENAMERAVAMTSTTVLFPEDFALDSSTSSSPIEASVAPPAHAASTVPVGASYTPPVLPQPSSLDEMEQEMIRSALVKANFNKRKTAEILGIDRVTLYRKAHKFGIPLKKSEIQNQ